MTEHDWLESEQAEPMLDFLIHKASDRKFRLFAVACCRRIWAHLGDERAREVVEVAGRFAEGSVDKQELRAVRRARMPAHFDGSRRNGRTTAAGFAVSAAFATVAEQPWDAARQASRASAWASTPTGPNQPEERLCARGVGEGSLWQPLRPPTWGRRTSWLALWRGLPRSRCVYAGQSFDRLPGLAGLLEEAGCDDEGLLAHLRKSGSHCRGCWALDRITGRW